MTAFAVLGTPDNQLLQGAIQSNFPKHFFITNGQWVVAKLEVTVHHLPSKGFIVVVVTTFLVIAGGLMTIAPKLWSWSGAITVATPSSH